MALRWRNSFSCNIKEIDQQHRKLFEISSKLNILEPICTRIDFEEEIIEIIQELKEYAIYHFDYEEKLLQRHGYEYLNQHHLEHEYFIQKVHELEQDDLNFKNPEIVRSIINFINQWITSHILKSDMKYKDYLNSFGVN